MNLIEKLGGYEKALDLFRGCPWDSGTVDVPNPRSKGMLRLELSELSLELLEYRRQHNIFEVGDKVIGSKLFDDRIFEFQYYLPELSMAVISKDGAAIGLNQLRHATDAEIKAGKRLEVS